jgi:hypothetical protein
LHPFSAQVRHVGRTSAHGRQRHDVVVAPDPGFDGAERFGLEVGRGAGWACGWTGVIDFDRAGSLTTRRTSARNLS